MDGALRGDRSKDSVCGALGVNGLLVDLDGTLYTNAGPIAGAREAFERICAAGIACRYITNATHKPRREVAAHLRGLGFQAEEAGIFTPAIAAAERLVAEGASCHALVNDALLEDLEGVRITAESPDYVLVGNIGEEFTYDRLNEAFRHLMNGAELIALLKNRYWESADGAGHLDAGPFVAALEYASGKKASCVGKPEREFFGRALEDLGLSPAEVAMVGDDLRLDVAGARGAGLISVLVESGRPRSEKDSDIWPDLVLESVARLPEALGLGGTA